METKPATQTMDLDDAGRVFAYREYEIASLSEVEWGTESMSTLAESCIFRGATRPS